MSERPAKIVAMTDIDALIEAMTVEEKLAQLGCVWSTHLVDDHGFSPDAARRLLAHGTGQITRIAASTGLRPQGVAVFANEIQRFLVEETRLGIPAVIHEESTAGFCARDAVQFPQAIAIMLPAIISQCVIVLKDTALGTIVGYFDLVAQARNIVLYFHVYVLPLSVGAAIFIILNYSLSRLAIWVQARMSRSRRSAAVAGDPLEADTGA